MDTRSESETPNPSATTMFTQVCIALAVSVAVFFYGGATQILQLGVVTLLLVALVAGLLRNIQQGSIVWSFVHSWLAFYAFLLIVNVYTSVYPENTRLVVWMFLVAPLVVLMCGQLTTERWLRLVFFFSLPLLVSAFWGFGEFLSLSGRASGPGIDPNSWASSLNIGFFLFVSAYFVTNTKWLPVLFGLLLVLALASFMAYSRVGLVVFLFALLFVLSVAATRKSMRRRALILLVAVASCYGALQLYRSSEAATQHTEGYTFDTEAYGWTLRFAQWRSAIDQYRDHPILGSGLGTFKVLYPKYRTLNDTSTAGNYVHNDYLQLLAEAGPLVVLLYVAFIGFLLYRLWLSLRRMFFYSRLKGEDWRRHLEMIILIVAVGTVFVHALMNFTLYSLLNQILMGCALSRLLYLSNNVKRVKLPLNRAGLSQFGVVLLASYLLVVNYADAVSQDLVYRGGILPLDRYDPDDQFKVFEILTFVRSFRGETSTNRFAMATFYRTSFDDQPAENELGKRSLAIAAAIEYQSGLEINPYQTDVRIFLEDFLTQNPWLMQEAEIYQTPEKLLRDGLALNPLRIRPHVLLAKYLQKQERTDEAYALLKAALPLSALRYDGYEAWRAKHQLMLLRAAKARGDAEVLEQLLEKVG